MAACPGQPQKNMAKNIQTPVEDASIPPAPAQTPEEPASSTTPEPAVLMKSSGSREVVMATLIAGLLRFGKMPRNAKEAQFYVDLVTPTTDAIMDACDTI